MPPRILISRVRLAAKLLSHLPARRRASSRRSPTCAIGSATDQSSKSVTVDVDGTTPAPSSSATAIASSTSGRTSVARRRRDGGSRRGTPARPRQEHRGPSMPARGNRPLGVGRAAAQSPTADDAGPAPGQRPARVGPPTAIRPDYGAGDLRTSAATAASRSTSAASARSLARDGPRVGRRIGEPLVAPHVGVERASSSCHSHACTAATASVHTSEERPTARPYRARSPRHTPAAAAPPRSPTRQASKPRRSIDQRNGLGGDHFRRRQVTSGCATVRAVVDRLGLEEAEAVLAERRGEPAENSSRHASSSPRSRSATPSA